MNDLKAYILIFLFLTIGFSCNSFARIVEKVVAVVDDEIITLTDVRGFLSRYSPHGMDEKKVLNILIENVLIQKEAKRIGLEVSAEDVKGTLESMQQESGLNNEEFIHALKKEGLSLTDYKEQIRENILKMRIVDVMLKNKLIIKDDEIQDYYEIHRHEFVMGAKVRLQNILFTITASATEDEIKTVYEKAEKVLELIKSGADFGELAKLYSDGPAAQLGGDLGYFTQDELMDDMGRWAFTLKEGEVSEIIKSPLGFNIIKVLEKIYDKVRPLDEVKEEIRSRLFSIKLEKRYEEWIEGLKRQTAIEIMM